MACHVCLRTEYAKHEPEEGNIPQLRRLDDYVMLYINMFVREKNRLSYEI